MSDSEIRAWGTIAVGIFFLLVVGGLVIFAGGSLGLKSGDVLSFLPIVVFIIALIIAPIWGVTRKGTNAQQTGSPHTPPEPVFVTCVHCGLSQRLADKCADCGAPLPRSSLY